MVVAQALDRPPHEVREVREDEHGFVLKCLLRDARKAPEFRRMPKATFYRHYEDVARAVLEDPTVVAKGVGRPGGGKLYTFALVEPDMPIIHFVYTAGTWRRFGFARMAIEAAGVDIDEPFGFTFPTKMTELLVAKRPGALYLGDAVLHRYS